MKIALLFAFIFTCHLTVAQKRSQYLTYAVTNSNAAYPFGRFAKIWKQVHPGFELGWQVRLKGKPTHDWYQQVNLGYSFHRFLQHSIMAYTNFGYQYRIAPKWRANISLGAGYLHSIAATGVFRMNEEGNYEPRKKAGRAQVMAAMNLGGSYRISGSNPRHAFLFINYQQRLQGPFNSSYVPILPYNSMIIGIRKNWIKAKPEANEAQR